MKRRRFLAGIGVTTLPRFALSAETTTAIPLIAFLGGVSQERHQRLARAFLQGLHELDDVEGRHFALTSKVMPTGYQRSLTNSSSCGLT